MRILLTSSASHVPPRGGSTRSNLAWIEALAAGYLGGKSRDLVPFLVVLAILIVKPYGIFGTRAIERL